MTMLARMLLFIALLVLVGCKSTNVNISVEYAIPKQYGDGKVAVTSTLVR